ncbi:hypothetical protein HYZ70_02165 [Candidatus Curtissbacteria bacterium]|nr:hypothetical protein [Candidatus Curtissbacteria bacterium]
MSSKEIEPLVKVESPTPREVLKTLRILAPAGSPPEQISAAMAIAAEFYKARREQK